MAKQTPSQAAMQPGAQAAAAIASGQPWYGGSPDVGYASPATPQDAAAWGNPQPEDYVPPNPSAAASAAQAAADQAAAAKEANVQAQVAALNSQFEMYGLKGLSGYIDQYVRQGYSGDTILALLRQTPEYKQRFPAMQALYDQGRPITEGQYIDYERSVAALESRWGLPEKMLQGNVTTYLTKSKSIDELATQVELAVADSMNSDPALQNTIRRFGDIDPNMALRAYYVDPEVSLPYLERLSASARIGAWAERQQFGLLQKTEAESLLDQGVTEAAAQQGFGRAASQVGLTAGKGDVVSRDQLVSGNLLGSAASNAAIQRAQMARLGRFSGGGGFIGSQQGATGLGRA